MCDMERNGLNIVAIILARGGSVGLPQKNIQPLLGKPLIYYTIKAALESKYVDRVIVSTDDDSIANVAKDCGAEIPFIRPSELAQNDSSSESALKHAVEWLEESGDPADIVVYLQTTDIFRHKWMIDAVIERLVRNDELESVFIAHPMHKKFWMMPPHRYSKIWPYMATKREYLPRQEGSDLCREDTGLACATRTSIIKEGYRIGTKVEIIENEDFNSCIDIHDEETLWIAEQVLNRDNGERYYL